MNVAIPTDAALKSIEKAMRSFEFKTEVRAKSMALLAILSIRDKVVGEDGASVISGATICAAINEQFSTNVLPDQLCMLEQRAKAHVKEPAISQTLSDVMTNGKK